MTKNADPAIPPDGFVPVYMIELYAEGPIAFDVEKIERELSATLGRVKRHADDLLTLFTLPDFPVELKDGRVCAQVALMTAKRGNPEWSEEASAQQSWRLRDARERRAKAQNSLLMSEMMSASLDHRQRRKIQSTVLISLLRNSNLSLLHVVPTQQYLDAKDVLGQLTRPEEAANPITPFLNVRFFNISNSKGDMVMDTMGLSALGLTDFQCHFRDLDPTAVAGVLHGLGCYVFERGSVIEPGHTIQGVGGAKWRVQPEMSLLEPKRMVLDVNPGPPFAAGGRP